MHLLCSPGRNTTPWQRASSATLNAQSTATELGWDPDMCRNVRTSPLLPPQPKVLEKNLGRHRTACRKRRVIQIHHYPPVFINTHHFCRYPSIPGIHQCTSAPPLTPPPQPGVLPQVLSNSQPLYRRPSLPAPRRSRHRMLRKLRSIGFR